MRTLKQRFWAKVDRCGDDECWEWQGYLKLEKPYGRFRVFGKMHQAHRVAWHLAYGAIPDDLFVCHHCDNHACVNPAHLWLGTVQDNANDMVRKGRSAVGKKHRNSTHPESIPRGEQVPRSKLTERQIVEIRRMVADGISQTSTAYQFGVLPAAISKIVNRQNWGHIP